MNLRVINIQQTVGTASAIGIRGYPIQTGANLAIYKRPIHAEKGMENQRIGTRNSVAILRAMVITQKVSVGKMPGAMPTAPVSQNPLEKCQLQASFKPHATARTTEN